MANGLVVILSGASSVGKHGIRDMLKNDPDLGMSYSISITTRPPKGNEKDGGDYYFVTFANFAKAVRNKELVEYTEFNGYYYGTPRAHLDFLLEQGKNVLLEVEAQGVGTLEAELSRRPGRVCDAKVHRGPGKTNQPGLRRP